MVYLLSYTKNTNISYFSIKYVYSLSHLHNNIHLKTVLRNNITYCFCSNQQSRFVYIKFWMMVKICFNYLFRFTSNIEKHTWNFFYIIRIIFRTRKSWILFYLFDVRIPNLFQDRNNLIHNSRMII